MRRRQHKRDGQEEDATHEIITPPAIGVCNIKRRREISCLFDSILLLKMEKLRRMDPALQAAVYKGKIFVVRRKIVIFRGGIIEKAKFDENDRASREGKFA